MLINNAAEYINFKETYYPGAFVMYKDEPFQIRKHWYPTCVAMFPDGLSLIDHEGRTHDVPFTMTEELPPLMPGPPKTKEWIKAWTEVLSPFESFSNLGFVTTVGTDPEIFVVGESGEVIPAFEFLPDKDHAVSIKGEDQDRTCFYDGFQAEWTTRSGLGCLGYLTDDVRDGLKQVYNLARKHNPKATLSYRSVINLPPDAIEKYDRSRFVLGCEPSMSAYGEASITVEDPASLGYRSAGWHMHFKPYGGAFTRTEGPDEPLSFHNKFVKNRTIASIKNLDAVLGVALTSFGQGYHDPRRRTLYGRAGEFRAKHTIEYRVPDVLLGAHPTTFNLFWDLGRLAWRLGLGDMGFLWNADEDEVREAINESNVTLAQKILKRNEVMLRRMLGYTYGVGDSKHPPVIKGLEAIYDGIAAIVETPTDVVKNWRLDVPSQWGYESHGRTKKHYINWGISSHWMVENKKKID
jgi:hypothetical protein